MPPLSSPGNVQPTIWLKNFEKPSQAEPALRPAPGGVRRPGDRPAEAVLPLGEERVVAGRDEHGLGGRLRRRAVVAQQRRQAALDAAQDRRGRGEDREELLLDDLLAGDLLGLLEEDVRDRPRVVGGVEPAAAGLRELLQERVGAAARADRRERDARGLHGLEDLVVLAAARPAVREQDDVAPGRRGVLERLHRLVQARVDVGLPERLDPGDGPLQVRDPAQRRGLDHPVGGLVEGDHAQLVALGQRGRGAQDRLLADVDLPHAGDPGPCRPCRR